MAATLRWVTRDPRLWKWCAAGDNVARRLRDKGLPASWAQDGGPKSSVFVWDRIRPLIQRQRRLEKRRARRRVIHPLSLDKKVREVGPKADRVTITLHDRSPDPRALVDQRHLEAQLEVAALVGRAHLSPAKAAFLATVLALGGPDHGVLSEASRRLGLEPATGRGYFREIVAHLRRVAAS